MSALPGISRDVASIISSAKSSLERSYGGAVRRNPAEKTEMTEVILAIEKVRLDFTSVYRNNKKVSGAEWVDAGAELISGLSKLVESEMFLRLSATIKFRLNMPFQPNADRRSGFIEYLLKDDDLSVAHVIFKLYDFLRIEIGAVPDAPPEIRDIEYLRELVPDQRIAPARFQIIDGRIFLSPNRAEALAEDRSNTASARETLIRSGERLLEQLRNSNCDRRLVEQVWEMQSGLVAEFDVIKLGILGIGCELMCSAFDAELPQAISGMLRAQTTGISMYVGQFPEWHRFAEQAAATSLSDGDVRVIANSAADLANLLQLRPEIADPEVPRTIVALNALIRDPARATKKAAFAVLRTMENLVASAFRYGVEFLDETARLTSRDMAKAVSKALVIGVLSVALASATELMPVAVKLGEAAWMKSAAEIVERQIKHLEEQG